MFEKYFLEVLRVTEYEFDKLSTKLKMADIFWKNTQFPWNFVKGIFGGWYQTFKKVLIKFDYFFKKITPEKYVSRKLDQILIKVSN